MLWGAMLKRHHPQGPLCACRPDTGGERLLQGCPMRLAGLVLVSIMLLTLGSGKIDAHFVRSLHFPVCLKIMKESKCPLVTE